MLIHKLFVILILYVGGSFDIADRTFRKLQTTWWLSSSESATDVKELIPEFFFLPEFLANSESKCQSYIPAQHTTNNGVITT